MSPEPYHPGWTVSIFAGCIVQRDAISNICRHHIDALTQHARDTGRRLRLKVYTHASHVADSRIVVEPDLASVVADEHFQTSDVIVYHFGIFYPLFDSIHLAPRTARVAVWFTGVTPPALLPRERNAIIYDSYRQAANMHLADRVLVPSSYAGADAANMGVDPARIVRLPPPTSFDHPPASARHREPTSPVRLVYVGRFVPAKGVFDLLRAFATLPRQPRRAPTLQLIGSRTFSDEGFLQQLQRFVAEQNLTDTVRFRFDVPRQELIDALQQADAVVIPSYHEGFCVPVIEAFTCGCFVISSDAGALPETSAGLGRTFRAGDVPQLASRLEELIQACQRGGFLTDGGFLTWEAWHQRTAQYSAEFTPARSRARFCSVLLGRLVPRESEVTEHLTQRRQQVLAAVRARQPGPCASTRAQDWLRQVLTPERGEGQPFAA